MRVVADGYSLGDASAYRGIGTYLRHLLPGLACAEGIDLRMLLPIGSSAPPGVEVARIRRRAPGRYAALEHDLLLPRSLRRHHPDVVLSPGVAPPRRSPAPWVQTVHGMLPFVSTDPALRVERERWERYAPRLQTAAALIAVSQHCADLVLEHLRVDATRVHVVHHGVHASFTSTGPSADAEVPYLLYVGEFGPWKGYAEAFAAAGAVADLGFPHVLKVAGRIVPWTEGKIEALRAGSPRPERIELLGHVDAGALPSLYRGASVVLMTSRFESFGLPTLEAMACGAAVVAFDNTATREIADGAAVLVPDGDVVALVQEAARLLGDEAWRKEVSARSEERARPFTWERAVQAHADILREVAGG